MLHEFGESHEGPFTGERPDASPGRHSIEAALGELIADPRVTGDLFYTIQELRKRVDCVGPTEQAQADAAFLLRWFRESTTAEEAVAPPAAPVYDEVAKAAMRERSIAAANDYNLHHSGADTTVLMYWTPVAPQD